MKSEVLPNKGRGGMMQISIGTKSGAVPHFYPSRTARLQCPCGATADVHDKKTHFYVQCPTCKRRAAKATFEKDAIENWQTTKATLSPG